MSDIKMTGVDPAEQVRRLSVSSPQHGPKGGSHPDQISPSDAKSSISTIESAAAKKADKEAPQEKLKEAVTKLNDYIQNVQRDLEFQMDEDSGKTIISVIDRHTNKVVRQIPDDVALRLAQELQQDEPLSLINMKV